MSIITKALKKAQEKRAGSRIPVAEDGPVYMPAAEPVSIKKVSLWGKNSYLRFLVAVSFGAITLGVLTGVLMVYVNRSVPVKAQVFSPEQPVPVVSVKQEEDKASARQMDDVKPVPGPVTETAQKTPPVESHDEEVINPADLPSLSGVMYSPSNPRAVINGVLVAEGEDIDGFTILKILPGKVRIAFKNKEFDLTLR